MTENLSIWIVGRDREDCLAACIENCRKLSGDIRYLDMDSSDGSADVARANGIPVLGGACPAPEFLGRAEEGCGTPWALFVRPQETLRGAPHSSWESLLARRRAQGFSIVIRERTPQELLKEFRSAEMWPEETQKTVVMQKLKRLYEPRVPLLSFEEFCHRSQMPLLLTSAEP